jgi:hypothetical protein
VSSYETPFCFVYYFFREDEEINQRRDNYVDDAIEERYKYLDLFAKEYGWDKDIVWRLRSQEKLLMMKIITKRKETEAPEDSAFQG